MEKTTLNPFFASLAVKLLLENRVLRIGPWKAVPGKLSRYFVTALPFEKEIVVRAWLAQDGCKSMPPKTLMIATPTTEIPESSLPIPQPVELPLRFSP
jgi:hypothetical protein